MGFLFVALGGAVGAMGRYAISLIPVKSQFPVLTLATNVMGAILIGFIVGLAGEKSNVSPNTILFLKTGLCGGFTTFSTFSLEAYNLFDSKMYALGTAYAISSVLLCLFGIYCGRRLALAVL